MDVPLHLLKGTYVDGDITGGLIPKNFLELSDIAINANGKKYLKNAINLLMMPLKTLTNLST